MTVYYVINKKDNILKAFNDAERVGIYILGKYVKEHIFIKEDEAGSRIINPKSSDAAELSYELELA